MASLNNVNPGDGVNSSNVQQLVDQHKGTAGAGNIPHFLRVNDVANYAVDVENQDPTNQRTFMARDSSGGARITVDGSPAQVTINQAVISSGTITGSTIVGGTITGSTMSLLNGSSNRVRIPSVRVSNSTTLPLSTAAAAQVLNWDIETWKTDAAMHSTAAASSQLIPTVPGIYSVGAQMTFPAGGSGSFRYADIRGGSPSISAAVQHLTTGAVLVNLSAHVLLSTSDAITVTLQTDSTAAIALTGQSAWLTFLGST